MNKQLVLIFVITFVLVGCSAPATPSQTPLASPTEVFPMLTSTPLPPTVTEKPATPTLTPEPALRTNGPYFAYFRQVPGRWEFQLVFMDADGQGRKIIPIPKEISDSLSKAGYQLTVRYVSPDGKWLAFYTGSDGYKNGKFLSLETYDLTLNLLNLTTGEKQVITLLLSKDYPNNFVEAAKAIKDPNIGPEDLQEVFLNSITQALAWSPDGRYLAFAGQMHGLSSDLYLYDMTTGKIQQKSNDVEELQWIDWSPDGKWILHGGRTSSVDPWIEYNNIYAVARDNSTIRNLGSGFTGNWLNSHELFEYRFGIEKYQLSLVNLETGKNKEIWRGEFGSYQVDPAGNWITIAAISSAMYPEKELLGFVYGSVQLINLRSLERTQFPDPSTLPPERFLHTKDGTAVLLPSSARFAGGQIFASPNMKYWVEVIKQNVAIYTQDWSLIKEFSIPFQTTDQNEAWPNVIQWTPDSSGLFLVYGTFNPMIYVINIPSGDVNLVEKNLTSDTKWINNQ